MTSKQIQIVEEGIELLQPIAMDAARLFYGKLFELDPSLRHMFRGDMDEQGRLLMNMLTAAARSLRRFDQLAPSIEAMGRRHACYGVRDEHYDTVATALVWTLEQGFGEAFTVEVRDAWVAMYVMITGVMRNGPAVAGLRTMPVAELRGPAAMV